METLPCSSNLIFAVCKAIAQAHDSHPYCTRGSEQSYVVVCGHLFSYAAVGTGNRSDQSISLLM